MAKKDVVAVVKENMIAFAQDEKTGSKAKVTNALANEAYDAVVEAFKSELAATGQLKISGLGNLSVVELKAGTARNPKTGEQVTVEARKTVRWAVSKVFRNSSAIQNAPIAEDVVVEDAE